MLDECDHQQRDKMQHSRFLLNSCVDQGIRSAAPARACTYRATLEHTREAWPDEPEKF